MSTFNLIFFSLIAVSLIGLVVIIYRKIPVLARLSNEEIAILNRKKGIFQKLKEIDFKHRLLNIIIASEKFLRRIKIIFLKIENFLSKCINFLGNRSQIMTQKSKEWIRQREMKRRKVKSTQEKIAVEINKEEKKIEPEEIEDDDLPIAELKKPIKEEQKWIDLIIEDPKNITAYKFLGLLYWKQYNYSDAKASLETAVKYGSKDKKVKEILKEMKNMNIK
ncbi:hypothetical protein KKH07_01545 [Patescibacteria group bacterium]|nr:hypothetical protein [Patescibacteria group bacterium]MBU1563901.1 hypothetical protein [Patescibacteria group bacterium]